jgi:divalent metal cation (Fe/Co/Zn/Cd) transporter
MEKNIEPEKLGEYARLIERVEHVKRIDRLRARGHGHYILVDVRVSVPGHLSVQDGHDISRSIKHSIMASDQDVDEVLVHINPWYDA